MGGRHRLPVVRYMRLVELDYNTEFRIDFRSELE